MEFYWAEIIRMITNMHVIFFTIIIQMEAQEYDLGLPRTVLTPALLGTLTQIKESVQSSLEKGECEWYLCQNHPLRPEVSNGI